MRINHYANSFISYKENNFKLICDPWVGQIKENAWQSYPTYKNGLRVIKDFQPNYIYISHLHTDHFDRELLKKWAKQKKNCKIIIKKFLDGRLKKSLKSLGFKNIIELKEWKPYTFGEHKIVIIPQITSNEDSIETSIEYDLDTSILIFSKKSKKIFFNNVDNPLSVKDIKRINRFVKEKFKSKIHICCMPVGAASEYPQCFLNIDRKKEKQKVIKNCINSVKEKLKIIKPDIFFQAGGSYLISGKFCTLNKFIAQPEAKQFNKNFKKISNSISIEGDGFIEYKNKDWIISNSTKKSEVSKKKVEKLIRKVKYDYEKKIGKISEKNLNDLYQLAKKNYFNKLEKFNIQTSWKIDFKVYKNLFLKNDKIDQSKSKLFKNYSLSYLVPDAKNYTRLEINLDLNLFYKLLKRDYPWNISLSGSYILFKRYPNKFDPNVTFSLNYLAC